MELTGQPEMTTGNGMVFKSILNLQRHFLMSEEILLRKIDKLCRSPKSEQKLMFEARKEFYGVGHHEK